MSNSNKNINMHELLITEFTFNFTTTTYDKLNPSPIEGFCRFWYHVYNQKHADIFWSY